MELRHLRYFVTIAHHGSFSLAAKSLGIAQPPLSQQIKNLEEELGIRLFDRSRKGIQLTPPGREFLSEATEILHDVKQIKINCEKRKKGEFGTLRVGVITAMATSHLAEVFREFRKSCPEVELKILDLPSAQQIQALLNGKLDIGFLGSGIWNKHLDLQIIVKEPMQLAVPLGHPLAKSTSLNWSDLAKEDFVLIHPEVVPSHYYNEFLQRCQQAHFDPRISIHVSNIATQLWMVSAGFGIAPVAIASPTSRKGGTVFLKLPGKPIYEELSVMWRKTDTSPTLQRLISQIRSMANALNP